MAGPNTDRESSRPNVKTQDKVTLTPGVIYDGVVISTSVDGMACAVKLDNGMLLESCILGRAVASMLLGFHFNYRPPQGTKCKVIAGAKPTIITLLDSDAPDPTAARDSYSITGTDKKAVRKTKTFAGKGAIDRTAHTTPRDLLEGEFQISNILGVALSMLTTMAKLSAGDRAKVEVFLLNDMVRIVSDTYRHFSAVGQQQIYNDGRANSRLDATSYLHEALGLETPKGAKLPVKQNVVDDTSVDKVLQTGRWRYSHFLGFLGDFFHVFVTDPVASAAQIGQQALRSGNAHLHVGSAGEVLVQSVSEIAFERVVRIPVPIELKRSDLPPPAGMAKEDFDNLDSEFLKLWNYDKTDPFKMVFQIREYARWLSTYHSLARFQQLAKKKGVWKVPTESALAPPDWTAQEDDKVKANGSGSALRFKDTYACIRIMRDGSILTLNGEGGSMGLIGKCGWMTVPAHMTIEAGGDMRFTSGQSMYFTARRSMELVAVAGGLRMKARTWFHGLCERGSIWVKSDAKDPQAPDYTAPVADDNKMGDQVDPLPIVLEHAVLIEGTQGRVGAIGTGALLAATGTVSDDTDTSADAVVRSHLGSARLLAGRDTELRAVRDLLMWAGGNFVLRARRALWVLTTKLFDIKDQMTLRWKELNINRVKSDVLSAIRSITGPKIGAIPDPASASTAPLRPHFNHIMKLPDEDADREAYLVTPATDEEVAGRDDYVTSPKGLGKELKLDHPIWDFEDPAEYQWADYPFFESLTQQRIRTDDDLAAAYGTWVWDSDNRISGGKHNGRKTPAVGQGARQLRHAINSKALHKPSTIAPANLNEQTPLTPAPITYKFLKK